MFVDVHCHLSFPDFDNDRDAVIKRLKEQQVTLLIDPGTDAVTSQRSIELAARNSFIYSTVGLHPHDITGIVTETTFSELETLAASPKVVGIGEIGLDYHYDEYDPEQQKAAFRTMLRMAKMLDLPVVIHSRDAWPDTLNILVEEKTSNLRGIMHCFSGNTEIARECIRLGFKISILGTLTYKKSTLPTVVKALDTGDLLTETDAPWLSPVPFRGKRNEPSYVGFVTKMIAEIKELPLETTAETIKRTAMNLFAIPAATKKFEEKRNR
jgi:TatD DNase family protein